MASSLNTVIALLLDFWLAHHTLRITQRTITEILAELDVYNSSKGHLLITMIKIYAQSDKMGCSVNELDEVEVGILLHLLEDPRTQIGDIADSLGIARNTVSSRMRRLENRNVIRSGGRDVDLSTLGFDVLGFLTLEVSHRELDPVLTALRSLDRVLEVHEISGRGDVWCRVVAQDTKDLHRTLRSILRIRGVVRSETSLALKEHVPYRIQPLLRALHKPV